MTLKKSWFTCLIGCFLLMNYPSMAQVRIAIDPRLGMDVTTGQFAKGYAKKDRYYDMYRKYQLGLNWSLGLLAEVNNKWQISTRWGNNAPVANYTYQLSEYFAAGVGFINQYHSARLHTEYTFMQWERKREFLKGLGLAIQGELALGYDYTYINERFSSITEYAYWANRITTVTMTRNGHASMALGANAQLTYNGKRHIKIGALLNYVPNPSRQFEFTLLNPSTSQPVDHFKGHVNHWFTFYVSYPIVLFNWKTVKR